MNRTSVTSLRSLFALTFLGLAACSSSGSTFTGECTTNDQCPVGAYCKKTQGNAGGICACRTDEACDDGEVCNASGLCQARSACRSNAECESPKFCDIASGNCLDPIACGTDTHCLPGTVCDGATRACVDGCLDDGDCPLFSACDRSAAGAPNALGRCLMGRCSDNSFCDFGDTCVNGMCTPSTNPNHCADCTRDRSCGDPRNFCLINSAYDPNDPSSGTESFCGVECDRTNPAACPSGYQCGGVVLLTSDQCTSDATCGGGGRRCVLGEGDLRGFCTCASDADCSFDEAPAACLGSCSGLGLQACAQSSDCISNNCVMPTNQTPGSCQWPLNTRCTSDAQCQPLPICAPIGLGGGNACVTDGVTPCTTAADCQCTQGQCIGSGRPCSSAADCNISCEGGGCVLGAACAPLEGLSCPDVR
ncbi:hypothetical protein L6R52_33585 [Myxococcota bacterium]|nr:hypothetical protein [Myxococcota bacterium]